MTGISPITIGLALAALIILVLALFMKRRAHAHRRPEPWEKAAIMKKLLELSEQDGLPTRAAVPVRSRAVANQRIPARGKPLKPAPRVAHSKIR